jgi:hypothetical protein
MTLLPEFLVVAGAMALAALYLYAIHRILSAADKDC